MPLCLTQEELQRDSEFKAKSQLKNKGAWWAADSMEEELQKSPV